MQTYTIDIRPRRQTTIPKKLLEKVGVGVGDKLEAVVENKRIILKPKKQIALDALAEIKRLINESGVSETQMQKNLAKIRKDIYDRRETPSISR